MDEKIPVNELKPIEKVSRVYSGKPGCMCGCRGKYWPKTQNDTHTANDKKMIKKIYKLFTENMANLITYNTTGCNFVSYDLPTKKYVIYF